LLEHKSVSAFQNYISFDENEVSLDGWVPDYLKFSFAHYDNKLSSLTNAVYQVMKKNAVTDYLYNI
jgi:hypothetical protein